VSPTPQSGTTERDKRLFGRASYRVVDGRLGGRRFEEQLPMSVARPRRTPIVCGRSATPTRGRGLR
jgi:hypothetical protein